MYPLENCAKQSVPQWVGSVGLLGCLNGTAHQYLGRWVRWGLTGVGLLGCLKWMERPMRIRKGCSDKLKKANFVLDHRRTKRLGCILYQASVYIEMGNGTVKCQAKSGKRTWSFGFPICTPGAPLTSTVFHCVQWLSMDRSAIMKAIMLLNTWHGKITLWN